MKAGVLLVAALATCSGVVACDLSGLGGGSSGSRSCHMTGGPWTNRELHIEGAIKIDGRYGVISSSSDRVKAGPFQILIAKNVLRIYDEVECTSCKDAGASVDASLDDASLDASIDGGGADASFTLPSAGEPRLVAVVHLVLDQVGGSRLGDPSRGYAEVCERGVLIEDVEKGIMCADASGPRLPDRAALDGTIDVRELSSSLISYALDLELDAQHLRVELDYEDKTTSGYTTPYEVCY
jgi:hypothetical protein